MKKSLLIMVCVLLLALVACAKKTPEQTNKAQEEHTTPDADWTLPETIELTEEVREIFSNAMNGLVGVDYEPLGFMGEKDGVYCILCRAAVVYPDAKPYYSLVYVTDQGVQNIWDIWMGAHSEKKE